MADTKPILLRPPAPLADAMTAAAAAAGARSRQAWMLDVLHDAARPHLSSEPDPDQLTLVDD